MVDQKLFHIGIKALVVENGKVLVLMEDKGQGDKYDLPGGRIDVNEGIYDAIKRELKEELGVEEFKLGELVFAGERQDYGQEDNIYLMLLFYKVEGNFSKLILSKEHTSYEWISKEDLDKIKNIKININPELIMALEKVLK